jgi:proteasome lid subunit RPN8/RPN11
MIVIPSSLIPTMLDHAVAWYPGECCGLLFAAEGTEIATHVECMENLQDKLHALDPVEHPRTSRNGFQLNGRVFNRLVEDAAKRGERLLAIFHSHIDCGAYFSQEDTDMAAPPPECQPIDPDLWHVVIDCQPGRAVVGAKAFKWDGIGYTGIDLPEFVHPAE